jgi:pyruvate dehydrogenase E1 component alpha subunit
VKSPTPEIQLSLYRSMVRIREFEERVAALYPEQQMRCPVHLSIGQEATAAGMCEALSRKDLIVGNHRSHGHYIAKGGSLRRMLAEMYGRVTGCSKGIGGSMHLIDLEVGVLCTTPIVGSTIPVAAGAAFACQQKKSGLVTTLFLGDAATEEGVFHETVNLAVLKRLPLIFMCENNFYSVYTHLDSRQPRRHIAEIARANGLPSVRIDGNDVVAVYESAREAVARAREGKGPSFIEAITYRWREHCGPNYDNDIGYRTEAEFLEWKARCPVEGMRNRLIKEGLASAKDLDRIRDEVLAEIEDAVRFAKNSEFPPPNTAFENVYAD